MKNILFFSLFIFSCWGGRSEKKKDVPQKIRTISYLTADKVTYANGAVKIDSADLNIIFYKNYTIYKIAKIAYKDFITTVKGDTIEDAFINPDTTFRFLIVKRENSHGLDYENINAKKGKRFQLDSVLKDIGIHTSMLEAYELNLGKPSEVIRNTNTSKIEVERFLNKKLTDSDSDSIYRYYDDKLNWTTFSFSPTLDKEKHSKLYKTSFINLYPKKRNDKDSSTVIRSEFYAEIKEVKNDRPNELILLIKHYETEAKRINLK